MIVYRLKKLLPGLFMNVLSSYYVLFYSFNCHIHELFWLIGFFVTFFYINNPAVCKPNSSGKTLHTRQKYFMQPWMMILITRGMGGSQLDKSWLSAWSLKCLQNSQSRLPNSPPKSQFITTWLLRGCVNRMAQPELVSCSFLCD